MTRLIATVCYIGLLRPWPGTWAAAAALPLAWLLHGIGGFPVLALATGLAFALGWWATAAETRGRAERDPGEIVIDEVMGQWLALWPLSAGLWFAGAAPWAFPYPGWIAAFALFRLFDIWKPGPIGWADRRDDAFGVMLDDAAAGGLAALVVAIAAVLAHGAIGL